MAKREYLQRQIGVGGINVMRRIKTAFDPEGILNPGKMFLENTNPSRTQNAQEGGSHA